MNSAGYIWSPHQWTGGIEIDGLPIEVRVDGEICWQGAAKAPFGKLLDPVIGYARKPLVFDALDVGMLVTTGTLCGLVELGSAPRHVAATLSGASAVDFNIRSSAA